LTGEDREKAGAFIVGRFEDGTPITMSADAKSLKEPQNDFDYKADASGSRCPFHSHIRKTNPRGAGGFESEQNERLHIMARRGIPYEDTPRTLHPDGLPEVSTHDEFNEQVLPHLPTGGVGLLFMAYNATLDKQFVFTQRSWANDLTFPKAASRSGLDGVIGQGPNIAGGQAYPLEWDNQAAGTKQVDFSGFVKMKGGEYFFAPSIMFLRNL
jgi:deferrochelatase/peroxidase EfeB